MQFKLVSFSESVEVLPELPMGEHFLHRSYIPEQHSSSLKNKRYLGTWRYGQLRFVPIPLNLGDEM